MGETQLCKHASMAQLCNCLHGYKKNKQPIDDGFGQWHPQALWADSMPMLVHGLLRHLCCHGLSSMLPMSDHIFHDRLMCRSMVFHMSNMF